jgi:hypothetical protein
VHLLPSTLFLACIFVKGFYRALRAPEKYFFDWQKAAVVRPLMPL